MSGDPDSGAGQVLLLLNLGDEPYSFPLDRNGLTVAEAPTQARSRRPNDRPGAQLDNPGLAFRRVLRRGPRAPIARFIRAGTKIRLG